MLHKNNNNLWLRDIEYIKSLPFANQYYLQQLCNHLSNYIYTCPVSVLVSWNTKNNTGLYFSIRENTKFIRVNPDISYRDYITVVNRFCSKFFPMYTINFEKEMDLSVNDIIEISEENKIPMSELIESKKIEIDKEIGIIYKKTQQRDEFNIRVNDKDYIRMSGSIKTPLSLKTFLKTLRDIISDTDRKNYIFNNSSLVKELSPDVKPIYINYSDRQMLSFFKINYVDLEDYSFTNILHNKYSWGKYIIEFDSDIVKSDCLTWLNNKK